MIKYLTKLAENFWYKHKNNFFLFFLFNFISENLNANIECKTLFLFYRILPRPQKEAVTVLQTFFVFVNIFYYKAQNMCVRMYCSQWLYGHANPPHFYIFKILLLLKYTLTITFFLICKWEASKISPQCLWSHWCSSYSTSCQHSWLIFVTLVNTTKLAHCSGCLLCFVNEKSDFIQKNASGQFLILINVSKYATQIHKITWKE